MVGIAQRATNRKPSVSRSRAPKPPSTGAKRKAARQHIPDSVLAELSRIPGVGPSIAADLYGLGVRQVSDLRGSNPESLYSALCRETGQSIDRCVLYVFRSAVYFASEPKPDPELLKWWNWKDQPGRRK